MENLNENQGTGVATTGGSTGLTTASGHQTVIGSKAAELAEILMENINKVKNDAKYIPQAESVNSQVKSMIELGKSEIEMLKVQAFMSSR